MTDLAHPIITDVDEDETSVSGLTGAEDYEHSQELRYDADGRAELVWWVGNTVCVAFGELAEDIIEQVRPGSQMTAYGHIASVDSGEQPYRIRGTDGVWVTYEPGPMSVGRMLVVDRVEPQLLPRPPVSYERQTERIVSDIDEADTSVSGEIEEDPGLRYVGPDPWEAEPQVMWTLAGTTCMTFGPIALDIVEQVRRGRQMTAWGHMATVVLEDQRDPLSGTRMLIVDRVDPSLQPLS